MVSNSINNIQYKVIGLGNDLKDVRSKLDDLEFDADINILALQPGVGKTTKIKKYLQENEKWLVTAPYYSLIDNEYDSIKRMKESTYWKGFSSGGCSKYENGDSYVIKLKDYFKLNPSIICRKACSKNEQIKCDYKNQFKKFKNVITVSAFYNTPYFYKEGEFKFKLAILDEELSGYEELLLDIEEINASLNKIYNYVTIPEEFKELDHKNDFLKIIENKRFFDDDFDNNIFFCAIENDQKAAIEEVIKFENWDDLKIIRKLNVIKLKKWIYYYEIYGEIRDYAEPNIYKIFDLARQGVKIVFSDASYSEKLFSELLKRYYYEDSKIKRSRLLMWYNLKNGYIEPEFTKEFKIKVYTSNILSEAKLYHMWSGRQFNRKKMPSNMLFFVIKSRRKYLNIGLASYKKREHREYNFKRWAEFEYFGGLRGKNNFKEKDLLFLIGTPLANSKKALTQYNLLFVENIQETAKLDLKSSASDEFNFDEYRRYLIDSEVYQAIHRIRPLENASKIIYIFGYIPEIIKSEFKVIEMNKKETEEFFNENFVGFYPSVLYMSINNYFMKHNEMGSKEIANEFKLYKDSSKKGLNTKLVTAIKKGIINPQNILKINDAIINGDKTTNDIKKRYRGLDVPDEVLESFIDYSYNGDFIKIQDW